MRALIIVIVSLIPGIAAADEPAVPDRGVALQLGLDDGGLHAGCYSSRPGT